MNAEPSVDVAWFAAAAEGDLWEGDILDVEVAGENVLLVAALGEPVRAFQGMCPHQEVSLADGEWDEERGILRCAGHHWEFDLKRGEGINPANCPLFAYAVRVRDGSIEIGIPQDGERHYYRRPET